MAANLSRVSSQSLTVRLLMLRKEIAHMRWKDAEVIVGDQNTSLTLSDFNYYPERIVTFRGTTDYIVKEIKGISKQLVRDKGTNADAEELITLTLIISSLQCAAINGKHLKTIKFIREISGATILITKKMLTNSEDKAVFVSGSPEQISKAIFEICMVMIKSPRGNSSRPYCVYFPYDRLLFVSPNRFPVKLLITDKEVEAITSMGDNRFEINERFREESGAPMVNIFVTSSRFTATTKILESSVKTSLTLVYLTGTPDEIMMGFSVVCKKLEETAEVPRPPMKVRFLISASACNLLEENAKSKPKDIPQYTGVLLYIPGHLVPGSSDKIISVTGPSESIMLFAYHICGITLEVRKALMAETKDGEGTSSETSDVLQTE